MLPKAQTTKEKIKLNFIELIIFMLQRTLSRKLKIESVERYGEVIHLTIEVKQKEKCKTVEV